MNGILLVDKPKGWTSFDVVGKIRGVITRSYLNETGKKRFPVGHTGTLDPLASGLLVLLLGTATKQAMKLTKLDKTYEVTMKLGEVSSTGDEEGIKTVLSTREPKRDALLSACKAYVGDIQQTPPAYSAIKIHGQRAYTLARAGKPVVLEPRTVHIYSLEITAYEYPFVHFQTDVSSGTYVRALVEDIGTKLETGAYMTSLKRTKVGPYSLDQAIGVENLSPEIIAEHAEELSAQ